MTNIIDPAPLPNHSRRSKRWLALLSASVLLHVIAYQWAEGLIGMPSLHNRESVVITTELKPVPPPVPPAVEKVAVAPTPRPQRAPVRHALPAVVQPEAESSSVTNIPGTSAEGPLETPEQAEANKTETPAPEATSPAPQESTATRYKISPPPSAELKYDVQALRKGQQWYGNGLFRWEAGGDSYRIIGGAGITMLFKITVLNFKSEGLIGEQGLAPVLYSEKPINKSLVNTHFQHANGKISFSASEASYPYKGGEQDRASIIWQLAGIGRGDPAQFASGTEIDLVVAGTRDADTWRIKVIGEEEIDTGLGKLTAWHVLRTPLPGSYDRRIDIWFAPQHNWYPVKVRYTEANGDFFDLSLTALTPITN